MEQIITLKVDLERPDDAKFAIDKAVEAYEQSKKHWDTFELNEAKKQSTRYFVRPVQRWLQHDLDGHRWRCLVDDLERFQRA